jgi:hypothetical protein
VFLAACVGDELPADRVGQAASQAAHRFHRRFPGGALAAVVGTAGVSLRSWTIPAM